MEQRGNEKGMQRNGPNLHHIYGSLQLDYQFLSRFQGNQISSRYQDLQQSMLRWRGIWRCPWLMLEFLLVVAPNYSTESTFLIALLAPFSFFDFFFLTQHSLTAKSSLRWQVGSLSTQQPKMISLSSLLLSLSNDVTSFLGPRLYRKRHLTP